MGSVAAPTTISLPRLARPPISGDIDAPLEAVATIAAVPPSSCKAAAGSVVAVDVLIRSELFCEADFFATARNGRNPVSQFRGVLDTQVIEPAYPLDGHQRSGQSAGAALQ